MRAPKTLQSGDIATTFSFVPEDGNAYHRVGSKKKESPLVAAAAAAKSNAPAISIVEAVLHLSARAFGQSSQLHVDLDKVWPAGVLRTPG